MQQKILIVDDEPDALELVKINLSNAGFFVATAADGGEAIKKARSLTPDHILPDVMLPQMDGLEACQILRGAASPGTFFPPHLPAPCRPAIASRLRPVEASLPTPEALVQGNNCR